MNALKLNRIYNEDCLNGLKKIPDNSVDLFFFDAPFYQGKQEEFVGKDKIENYRVWIKKVCSEAFRILKDGGNVAYLNAPKYIYKTSDIWLDLFEFRNDIPLIRQTSFNPAWMLGFKHNLLLLLCKGSKKLIWNGSKTNHNKESLSDVWDDIKYRNGYRGKGSGNFHPEAIQVDLTKRIVELCSNENGLVLDPCIGSGTTAISCIRTNRKYVGFEVNEKYFGIATRRIENELQQLSMF